jgi:hypothetical protein
MAKKYLVTRIDSKHLPQVTKHSPFATDLPEMFDSREQADEFVHKASIEDPERRYILGVNEVDEPESKALSS